MKPTMARISPFFPAMLVFAGALLVAIGGFWASWRQSNFNSEIRRKNEEIARLQLENVNAITGGDSFAFAQFQIFDKQGKPIDAHTLWGGDLSLVPVFVHKRKYPLYDVSVRFVDIDQPIGLSFNANTFRIGNMAPALASSSSTIRLLHYSKNIDFNIFFSGRNGLWIQFLRMVWLGDGWTSANKVMRGSEEVFREVSPNFPRSKDGSIDWEKTEAQDTRLTNQPAH